MALFEPPQPDSRLQHRERETPGAKPRQEGSARDDDCAAHPGRALWSLFANVKYWASKKGPRKPGQRPEDLQAAALRLRDALEACWRAGYRSDAMADELLGLLRRGGFAESEIGQEILPAVGICGSMGSEEDAKLTPGKP